MESTEISTESALQVDYTEKYPITFRTTKKPETPSILSASDALYIKAGPVPDGIRKKRITATEIKIYAKYNPHQNLGTYVQRAETSISTLQEAYDEEKIQQDHELRRAAAGYIELYDNQGYDWKSLSLNEKNYAKWIANAARNGICIVPAFNWIPIAAYPDEYDTISIYPPGSSYTPKIAITYQDAVLKASAQTPSAGWVDRKKPVKLSWIPKADGQTIDTLGQAEAIIRWKEVESGEINTITLATETEYTIQANTLPQAAEIMWQVQLTSDDGVTEPDPEWNTITTIDATPTVRGISPSAGYIDGNGDITFEWGYEIETGSEQSAYELQIKGTGSDWVTIAAAESESKSVAVSARDIPSGVTEWRVRAANTDGVYSAWSDPLSFIMISAPEAPIVSILVSAPRPVITWQSKGQQAFELEIGEQHKSGVIFGTEKTYQMPDFLPNGYHEVSVRVLNEFGLWSPWGLSAVEVLNVPGEEAIRLGVNSGIDARLGWTAVQGVSEYWVYRNEERIAKVSGTEYTDRTYLGTASYFVRAVHADGYNYTDSNRVTLTLSVDRAMITALDGEWLDIGHSLTSVPNVSVTRSQDVAMMQYNGARLPIPEVSPFEQRTYSISCAFADRQMAARFDELLCRLCCVKDQYGNCMVGMLYSYTRTQNTFTTAYTATLYEVDRSVYEEN